MILGCSEANKIDELRDRLDAVEEKVDGFGKTLEELKQLIEKHLVKSGKMMILSNFIPNHHRQICLALSIEIFQNLLRKNNHANFLEVLVLVSHYLVI